MKRNSFITFALAALALLGVCFTQAEVITKGGGIQLRPSPKEISTFSFTNGAANPGLPLIFRVTSAQPTNHIGFTTNGNLAAVNLGTNFVAVNSALFFLYHTNSGGPTTTRLHFVNGILVSTNWVQGTP